MTDRVTKTARSEFEIIALLALLISLVALATDAMLPALPQIGDELGVTHENNRQQVISIFFLGFAVGQMIYGPLSDSVGRKLAMYGGLAVFMIGSLLSVVADTFQLMLLGRLLQGFGAAGPRIVVVALVRDQYEGRAMARVMSAIMAVFILVPALAPAVGQGVMMLHDWRAIFVLFIGMATIALVWLALRQPETLPSSRRTPFSLRTILRNIGEVLSNRRALGYTLATGMVFAAFIGYLTSSQQIFQDLYQAGDRFALYFAILSLAIGAASLANSRQVMRFGMRALCRWSLLALVGLCGTFFAFALFYNGAPPFWTFMACFMAGFFAIGFLFGNLNALAMEPLGHIAGTGAAVVGSVTTIVSLVFGAAIGAMYNDSILPLVGGFAGFGLLALLIMRWTDRTPTPANTTSTPKSTLDA